jgi:hypothetical protein
MAKNTGKGKFGANDFGGANDDKSSKDEDAQVKDQLTAVVNPAYQFEDGTVGPVTGADILSTQVRQTVTRVLKVVDPKGYAEYRALKYKNGPVPSLADRRAAYEFAFKKFMEATYKIAGF